MHFYNILTVGQFSRKLSQLLYDIPVMETKFVEPARISRSMSFLYSDLVKSHGASNVN